MESQPGAHGAGEALAVVALHGILPEGEDRAERALRRIEARVEVTRVGQGAVDDQVAAHQTVADGRWERSRYAGTELSEKVLGIVGFGRIGRLVAARAQAFDMEVIAFDPYVSEAVAQDTGVMLVNLDELYARDGTCATGASHIDPTFGHFTALPPANDYQALCTTTDPGAPCDPVPPASRQLHPSEHRGGSWRIRCCRQGALLPIRASLSDRIRRHHPRTRSTRTRR